MAIADHLVLMNHGSIEDQGPPERVYRHPATRFAASFLGEMNFIKAVCRGGAAHTAIGALELPAGSAVHDGQEVTACLRPEHVAPADGVATFSARVIDTVFQGVHRRIRVEPAVAPGTEMVALLPAGMDAAQGDMLQLRADLRHGTLLPEAPA